MQIARRLFISCPEKVTYHCFSWLWRVISQNPLTWSFYFWKPIWQNGCWQHHNFSPWEIFRRELISKNIMNMPKIFQAKRWIWLTTVPQAYNGFLFLWRRFITMFFGYLHLGKLFQHISAEFRRKITKNIGTKLFLKIGGLLIVTSTASGHVRWCHRPQWLSLTMCKGFGPRFFCRAEKVKNDWKTLSFRKENSTFAFFWAITVPGGPSMLSNC